MDGMKISVGTFALCGAVKFAKLEVSTVHRSNMLPSVETKTERIPGTGRDWSKPI